MEALQMLFDLQDSCTHLLWNQVTDLVDYFKDFSIRFFLKYNVEGDCLFKLLP